MIEVRVIVKHSYGSPPTSSPSWAQEAIVFVGSPQAAARAKEGNGEIAKLRRSAFGSFWRF